MRFLAERRWFLWFAPVTVPVYLLYLAFMSLLAGSYYVTVELTLSPLLRHPFELHGWRFWAFAPVAFLLMPPAMVGHVLVWGVKQLGRMFVAVGHWQSAAKRPWLAGLAGFVWTCAFVWSVLTCIDAQAGMALLGRGVPGVQEYERAVRRQLSFGELSPDVQVRRERLIASLEGDAGVNPNSRLLADYLRSDGIPFGHLANELRLYYPAAHPLLSGMIGVPWYFISGAGTIDQVDHSRFLLGPILLALMLLVRWPGLHGGGRRNVIAPLLYLIRVGGVVTMMVLVLNWQPMRLPPPPGPISAEQAVLSPAVWLGANPRAFLPPEWIPLNIALWLIIAGLCVLVWWIAAVLRPFFGAPAYYSAFLAVRLLQRKRIAFFSIGAVTLCVAMELIVISVMGGFLDTIRNRSHELIGDLVIDGDLTGFPYYDEFRSLMEQLPAVEKSTPVIASYGLLHFFGTDKTKAVEVRGIRLDEYSQVNAFGKGEGLYYNRYYPGTTTFAPASQPLYYYDDKDVPRLPEPYERAWQEFLASRPPQERLALEKKFERVPELFFPGPGVFTTRNPFESTAEPEIDGIILGRDVLFQRLATGEYERYGEGEYPKGCLCELSLLPPGRTGKLDTTPINPHFRYVDDARSGVYEIDSRTVYVDFDHLQGLLNMSPQTREDGQGKTPARCTQIQVKLRPGTSLIEARDMIADLWERFRSTQDADARDQSAMRQVHVSTWEELQQMYIAAIEKEKVLTVIMFGIISIVAVLLVLCIFYMIVVEKTRDIGIIKSVGGSAQGVAAIFLSYGAAIGVVGAGLGLFIGAMFVRRINEFQEWLARLNPAWRVWSPETYSFDRIPDTVKVEEMIWIAAFAILASIIGAVVPAIRAARTWPVEALRYE